MGVNDIKKQLGHFLCHSTLLIYSGMRAKILPLSWKLVLTSICEEARLQETKGFLTLI